MSTDQDIEKADTGSNASQNDYEDVEHLSPAYQIKENTDDLDQLQNTQISPIDHEQNQVLTSPERTRSVDNPRGGEINSTESQMVKIFNTDEDNIINMQVLKKPVRRGARPVDDQAKMVEISIDNSS